MKSGVFSGYVDVKSVEAPSRIRSVVLEGGKRGGGWQIRARRWGSVGVI